MSPKGHTEVEMGKKVPVCVNTGQITLRYAYYKGTNKKACLGP